MYEHIRTYAKFYRVMLGENGDPGFSERIQRHVEKRMRRALPDRLRRDRELETLFLGYVAKGSIAVILWWLDHDYRYSPSEMAALSIRLSVADLGAVLESTNLPESKP
jgi:hypothetical protein